MTTRTTTVSRRNQQRPSTSGSSASTSSSSFSGSQSTDVADRTEFANYSPTSEAISLSDEDDEYSEALPEELHDPWDFVPKPGNAVWVKSSSSEHEVWFLGHVQKSTRSGTVRGGKQGIFYMVRYRNNLRKYFSPLLGDIKPDTPHVRILLKEAGCDMHF